ncbi:hypothetical protein ATCVGM07011_659L [Acanthocystis turfacea Chlorella virus GM0701.1]|nr:hypothetical protein ATCVGM07011_659L [Acanthocystis turfacea Chlorella virus GM0701.1]
MWLYTVLFVLILAIAIAFTMRKRETFTWKKFPANLTEQIKNVIETTPMGTAPSSSFEGNTYVPGFFKIKTKFPMLTKWKPRTVDIMA